MGEDHIKIGRKGALARNDPKNSTPPSEHTAPTCTAFQTGYRGTSPIKKSPPPYDPPTTTGIGLR